MSRGNKPEVAAPPAKDEVKVVLEDEPTKIKLAALAGRTTEARAKVAALIASGAKDEEIAEWLATVLVADPGALEDLIAGVPADKRTGLVRLALSQVIALHPDSVWEVIRASPLAAEAARAKLKDDPYPGLDVLTTASRSSMAAEVLFDPANGFSSEEIARFFRFGGRDEANSRRVLDEWIAGRWEGEPPECVQAAWAGLRWLNEAELRAIEAALPEPLKKKAGEFESLALLQKRLGSMEATLTAEDLGRLGAEELASLQEERSEAGKPLPLELLSTLPEDKRGKALENYFQWSYPFSLAAAREAISRIDTVPLTRAEKDGLYQQAAENEWNSQGDAEQALTLAARIADDKTRGEVEADILEELARYDPRSALERAGQMPEGELREKILKMAAENLP